MRPGLIRFKAIGKNILKYFKNESGVHIWQRIPPTEKRNRVHTSTITVAILSDSKPNDIEINDDDLDWKYTRDSGPGGQHRNKTNSCVHLTHIPTGTKVKIDGRKQSYNKKQALNILKEKIQEREINTFHSEQSIIRNQQIGSAIRGDKVRTIRVRDDIVIDHRLNRKITYKEYIRGNLSKLR